MRAEWFHLRCGSRKRRSTRLIYLDLEPMQSPPSWGRGLRLTYKGQPIVDRRRPLRGGVDFNTLENALPDEDELIALFTRARISIPFPHG